LKKSKFSIGIGLSHVVMRAKGAMLALPWRKRALYSDRLHSAAACPMALLFAIRTFFSRIFCHVPCHYRVRKVGRNTAQIPQPVPQTTLKVVQDAPAYSVLKRSFIPPR
jgi:hypothetical protein